MPGESGALNIKAHAHSAILVTGATGFVGRYLVRKLARAGKRIMVLARRRAGVPAQARIAQSFGELSSRLDVVEGDLADSRSLKNGFQRLPLEIATVIHCAGETSFTPAAQLPARPVQIEGPLTLLRILAARGLRRWSHVSTAYVCGRRSGVVWEHETDVGQEFHNPYERLKLQSEVGFKLACRELGVGLVILRPSIVIGPAPATNGGAPSNLLFTFIRMLSGVAQKLGNSDDLVRVRGSGSARFNIVPVEYVVSAIAELSDETESAGRTFHLVAANPPTQNAVAEVLSARLGLRGLHVVDAGEELSHPSRVELRLEKLLHPYKEYLEQHVQFDASSTGRLLAPKCLRAPDINRSEIHRLVELAACASTRAGPV
jgi:nucleoside-diphosphate-sugar epimerase